MAASDHLNNYIKAYHISWGTTPPHERDSSDVVFTYNDNVHPDALHMGTRRAAIQIHRTHLHEYEINPSALHPVTQGDSPIMKEKTEKEGWRAKSANEAMRGLQPELWETVSADPRQAVRTGQVLPYRNLGEDTGSISFIVPKSAINSGAVRYVGVTDLTAKDDEGRTTRSKIEEEEKMYGYEKPD